MQILHQTDDRLEEDETRHENEDVADGGQANGQINSIRATANYESKNNAAETTAPVGNWSIF